MNKLIYRSVLDSDQETKPNNSLSLWENDIFTENVADYIRCMA